MSAAKKRVRAEQLAAKAPKDKAKKKPRKKSKKDSN